MAHSAQAKKRIRQSEKRRIRNKSKKSEIRTLTRRLREHVAEKDGDKAKALLPRLFSRLDKAAKTNVFHRNNVARQKAKATRLVRTLDD